MHCPRCQHENPPGAKFCVECASAIGCACPACGTEAPPTAKFCPECATPLSERPTARPEIPAPAPRAYTPKHLADKILQSKSALEGERKQVTVLFADVKGSMELAEQVDPEEWHTILDRFFQILTDGVHRFEGTIKVSRVSRGLTRFVGRDADLRTIEDALAQAQAGTGQVIGVVAEAGAVKAT